MMGLTNSILFEKNFFSEITNWDIQEWHWKMKFFKFQVLQHYYFFNFLYVHSYFDFSSFSIRIYVYNLMALLNCIFGGNKKAFFYCLHGQQGPSMMYFFSAYVHYLAEHVSNQKLRICIRRRPQKFGPSSSYKLTLLFK